MSGVIPSSHFNQGTYAPGTVEARTTQDLLTYPAGGVFQPGAPGTGYAAYGAVQSNIIDQGICLYTPL